MSYISIYFESKKKLPKYKMCVLIAKSGIYVHPEAILLNETIAVLDYYDSTIKHKNHIYIELSAVMRNEFVSGKVLGNTKALFNTICCSQEYTDATNLLYYGAID